MRVRFLPRAKVTEDNLHIDNYWGTIQCMRELHRYEGNIKKRVLVLRSQGKTYSEIMRVLGIKMPKSTLSNWCSNVTLPEWYHDKINQLNAQNFSKVRKIAMTANKLKQKVLLDELAETNRYLKDKLGSNDVLKMLLAVLYLGEGSKWRSHRGLMLGSSDPNIIRLYIRLLQLCYGITPEKLSCRVSYRADQDIRLLEKYWAHVTSISLKNFYKTIPDPRTVGRPTKQKDYKGVAVISCAGTRIQLELEMIPKIILEGL